MPARRIVAAGSAGVVAAVVLVACGSASDADKSRAIAVRAGTTTCQVSTATLESGRHTFTVHNTSDQVTEVYVYAAGDRIIGEVENIGPDTSRALVVDLPAGDYQVACKPGMVGSGIRSTLRVSGAETSAAPLDARLDQAATDYRRYVESTTAALADATAALVGAVKAGRMDEARRLYPAARVYYERIEPIAESFGTLDPLIDMRVDDATGGTPFVGFHRLERDLWQTRNVSTSAATADALLTNVHKLQTEIPTVPITALTMANGAKSLLDEVAKSKVTGEEERYSRIDLVDFQANVEGSQSAYTSLRPVLADRDTTLVTTLDTRFTALLALLASHRSTPGGPGSIPGSAFVDYDTLTPAQVKALAVKVDDLSEPLGQLAGVLARR